MVYTNMQDIELLLQALQPKPNPNEQSPDYTTVPPALSTNAGYENEQRMNDMVLEILGRTEGKGMDDDVEATVDGKDPAALSAGEFVVPADAVSLLGDGNTEAGAKVLEQFISTLREKKTGQKEQPGRLEDILQGLMSNE